MAASDAGKLRPSISRCQPSILMPRTLKMNLSNPFHDMYRNGDQHRILVMDADRGFRASPALVDCGHRVGRGNRVADEHPLEEADPVITERDRRRARDGSKPALDRSCRCRRHVT